MDKPPTEAKPNAEQDDAPEELDAEAQDRSARLRQLTSDYVGAFYRDPGSVENLETAQLLAAIRSRELRKKLAAVLARETNKAFGESHGWLRRMWIDSIPFHIERRCAAAEREGIDRNDAIVREAIARDLITTMPADLQTRCPGYPPLIDPDKIAAAAVTVAQKVKAEVSIAIRAGDPDAIKIGRATLTALGCERARDLLPYPKD